jgi:hypothetical protein
MTSEIEANIDELKAEAKALGLTGWQAMKDPVKLMAKIEAAKKVPVRSKAPKMDVFTAGGSDRGKLIASLEKDDPECKYLTQSAKLTAEEAKAKGFEIMKKPNGEIMYCKNDIVCRTDKEAYYKWQGGRNDHSINMMKSIDKDLDCEGGGEKIKSVAERPER